MRVIGSHGPVALGPMCTEIGVVIPPRTSLQTVSVRWAATVAVSTAIIAIGIVLVLLIRLPWVPVPLRPLWVPY